MNFLIKIEEAINHFIVVLLAKLKEMTPDFIFQSIAFLAHLPYALKKKAQVYNPKIRLFCLKLIGYTEHYTTAIRGHLISVSMYLRSDEFKKADKITLILTPFRYIRFHPLRALSGLLTLMIFASALTIIFKNTEKIARGTHSLRKPASIENAEEDVYIEFKNHKFEVKIEAGKAGGHGAAEASAHEFELYLNIRIEANNPRDKKILEHMEEMLEDNIEAMELSVTQLPLGSENQKLIEESMGKSLNESLKKFGYDHPIKSIQLKQVLPGRPQYYRQAERMMSVTEINLQIFLEDTHRNRQVWLDFSILASNRNIILYLSDHEVELKDHLTTNVEPVIPQLPIEDEGRLIIKDKIRSELNQFLKENGIEGKILEVYIDYLIAS